MRRQHDMRDCAPVGRNGGGRDNGLGEVELFPGENEDTQETGEDYCEKEDGARSAQHGKKQRNNGTPSESESCVAVRAFNHQIFIHRSSR